MTPKGHIALDSREYVLSDYRQYRQMLGNQMAWSGSGTLRIAWLAIGPA